MNAFSSDSLVCGTLNEFSQRKIEMQSYITSNKRHHVSKGSTLVSKLLQENPSTSAVIFCNSCKQSKHFWDQLEQNLKEKKLNLDVIHTSGPLHKINKFWRLRLSCDGTHMREADFCVLVTTNAANVDIDKPTNAMQMRFNWLHDLLAYFQEQGRGLWHKGLSWPASHIQICCFMYSLCCSSLLAQIVSLLAQMA